MIYYFLSLLNVIGYARQGAAFHASHKYNEAIESYENGLKMCPGDSMLESALKDVKDAMNSSYSNSSSGDYGGGEAAPDMGSMFANLFGPDMFTKLEAHPATRESLKDPSFVSILNLIKSNPNMLTAYLKDPRVMNALQVLLNPAGASGFPQEGMCKRHVFE